MGEAACTEAPVFALLFFEGLGTSSYCCEGFFALEFFVNLTCFYPWVNGGQEYHGYCCTCCYFLIVGRGSRSSFRLGVRD